MDFNEIVNDAKKLAEEHPEQAKEALDKAEGVVNERTGDKFTDQVSKGGDAVEGRLGLPADNPTAAGQ